MFFHMIFFYVNIFSPWFFIWCITHDFFNFSHTHEWCRQMAVYDSCVSNVLKHRTLLWCFWKMTCWVQKGQTYLIIFGSDVTEAGQWNHWLPRYLTNIYTVLMRHQALIQALSWCPGGPPSWQHWESDSTVHPHLKGKETEEQGSDATGIWTQVIWLQDPGVESLCSAPSRDEVAFKIRSLQEFPLWFSGKEPNEYPWGCGFDPSPCSVG